MNYILNYLGCRVNSCEINAIRELLNKEGNIESESNVDFVVINTCSVTSVADKKSRQMISHYRRNFSEATICVMGCFTQGTSKEKLEEIDADIIIGNTKKSQILEYIRKFEINKEKIIDIDKNFRNFSYDEMPIINLSDIARAYVKIQDGCNNFCSYCLIPFVRGASRSRKEAEIIHEIQNLVNNKYKEIVLTGIDVASYGLDFENKTNFSNLLEDILDNVAGDFIIRISSIEESMIDDKFLELIKNNKKIARHMHMSLQSGSDSVLKRMNRKYTTNEFYEKVQFLYKSIPDINLTTDIIVGFPGETEIEANETFQFIQKCKFSHIHVFPYSKRQGTAAAIMKNQVDSKIKKERVKKLLELDNKLKNEYESKFFNKELGVLIESYDEKSGKYIGHTSNYIEVECESKENIVGKVIKIVLIFDNVKKL